MAQVRLLTGRFAKLDGQVVETYESLPTGAIANIPAVNGTNGCSLAIGNFAPRIQP